MILWVIWSILISSQNSYCQVVWSVLISSQNSYCQVVWSILISSQNSYCQVVWSVLISSQNSYCQVVWSILITSQNSYYQVVSAVRLFTISRCRWRQWCRVLDRRQKISRQSRRNVYVRPVEMGWLIRTCTWNYFRSHSVCARQTWQVSQLLFVSCKIYPPPGLACKSLTTYTTASKTMSTFSCSNLAKVQGRCTTSVSQQYFFFYF